MIEGVRVHRFNDGDVIDHFRQVREQFRELGARLAVLGYALLTTDGQWLTPGHNPGGPGEPVTFADRLAYTEQATTHLDGLDPQTLLVGLTCHA